MFRLGSSISYSTLSHAQAVLQRNRQHRGSEHNASPPAREAEHPKLPTELDQALVQNSDPSKPMSHVKTLAGEDAVPRRQDRMCSVG